MPGMYKYSMEIESNVKKLLLDTKELQDRMDTLEGKEYKINLNIDEKKLGNVISNLEKMLDSLGKGTGDFKQFENLSKELSSIVLEVQSLSKAFGKVDDSGAKTLLSSIQNIDKSLSDLSQNILNVNKNMSNMGGNTNGAVKQVENIGNAYQDAAKEAEKLADAQSKIGQKTNISSGSNPAIEQQNKLQEELKETQTEIIETRSKYQSLLDVAKKQLDDDKGTNYYSGKTTETKAFDNFTFNEQAKRSSHFDVWSKDYEELCSLIDKTEEELESGSIGFDDAIDRMVSAYQKYDTATKIDVGGFDFLNGVENVPSVLSDTEKAVLNENKAIKESEYTLQDYINTYLELKKVKESSLSVNPKITGVTSNGRPIIKDGSDESFKAELMMKDMESEVLQIYGKDLSALADEHIKASESAKEHAKAENQVTQAVKEVSSTASQDQKKDAFPDKDISASVESATNSIKEENNVLEQNTQKVKENTQAKEQNANVNLNKYDKRLDSYNGKVDKYQATIARFNDGGWTSDTYLKNVQAVKNAVNEYETLLNELKGKDASLVTNDDISKLDNYEKKIKDTIATVTNMSASEKGYNFVSGQKELDKIHKLLNENSKMSSEAKAKIRAYYAEIESGNPSMSLDKIHGEILKIYNAEVEAGRAGRTLWDTLKNSGFHQIAAQMAGMFGVYDVINIGKNAFNTVKELDYALVDLKKTTAMNSSELEQFYYDSNDVAKQMGVTTKEIIDQASSWSRLGYNSKQAATEMAKLSSQFALISPGMDTTTSQEGLVSIMKAWDIGYQDVKSQIMDDINALGNAMAEDNQDIVEGMERSAAALAAVGTSTKDAFALFSGIQEVLQNSEKSGTSLRSVALRLRSFDESTEEYSSDLANITGELADLTKTAEHAQGVSVFKDGSTTEFKSLVDYFREIADIWDEMSQKQQNDFLLKAFGRTQAQAGAALIQNFKGVEKALNVMDNAAGSSDKEMETAKQSITYKLNELKQTWVGTVQDIAKRKDLSLIMSGLIGVSKGLGFVIGKLGLIPSVIAPIAAILGKGKSTQRFCPVW